MEATWMSIDKWIYQEDVVQICNGILLSHKKEQMWISWTAVDETRICYTSEVSQKEKNKYRILTHIYGSDQIRSVSQSCPTLCDPMNRSTPGLPVHHQLPEFTQTHVHWVGDAIQPSHPLLSPSPPAHNPSQHQGIFQRVNSSHQVAKVLEFQLQHQSFQWTPRTDLLQNGLVGSPCSPRDSQESSPPQFKSIILRCSAFFIVQLSHPYMTTGNHNHKKLTNLITWTTALSNSMKLWAMLCRATQDGWVIVESSDKMWSTA